MRKQKMRLFQKGICGILSAAMILTSSMIPDFSVFAAPSAMEETESNSGMEEGVDQTSSEENKAGAQNPDAGIDESDANNQDKLENDTSEGDEVTTPDVDADSDNRQDGDESEDEGFAGEGSDSEPEEDAEDGDPTEDDSVESDLEEPADDATSDDSTGDDGVEDVPDEEEITAAEDGV